MHPPVRKVAVVGASGYAGEVLLELLRAHPGVKLVCLTSRQFAGQRLEEVYPRLAGGGEQDGRWAAPVFVPPTAEAVVASGAEFAFLALPHGLAAEFARPLLAANIRVVDLSADFRLGDAAVYEEFYGHPHPAPELLDEAVYGMPELPGRRAQIAAARLVAAPGCYPTSITLPLVPLLTRGLIDPDQILVTSLSGVTGAGRKAAVDLLFGEVNESVKAYGIPKHRHLSEIEQELSGAAGRRVVINFTPHLLPVSRGILTTIYVAPTPGREPAPPDAVAAAWRKAYAAEPFVRLRPAGGPLPELAHVVRTPFVDLAVRHDPRTGRWVLVSAEDKPAEGRQRAGPPVLQPARRVPRGHRVALIFSPVRPPASGASDAKFFRGGKPSLPAGVVSILRPDFPLVRARTFSGQCPPLPTVPPPPCLGGSRPRPVSWRGATFAGIKPTNKKRADLAVVFSEVPATGAGTFTTNKIQAAPVKISKAHLRTGDTPRGGPQQRQRQRLHGADRRGPRPAHGPGGGRRARRARAPGARLLDRAHRRGPAHRSHRNGLRGVHAARGRGQGAPGGRRGGEVGRARHHDLRHVPEGIRRPLAPGAGGGRPGS